MIILIRHPLRVILPLVMTLLLVTGLVYIGSQVNRKANSEPLNPEIAIVIDDFGIDNPGTQQMLALKIPLTAAVMPNLLYTKQEAELIHKLGYEIILHMPVEAKSGRPEWLGTGALTTGLSPEQLRSRLEDSLAQVRYAVGISNHMGSRGTENSKVVAAIVDVAKKHHLLVLDSKTSETTILAADAQKAGVPSAIRDVFLDNANDLGSIKKQIRQLMLKAKTSGKAIGIGHVGPQGPTTARAIKEMLPEIQAEGIKIVPLSELLKS